MPESTRLPTCPRGVRALHASRCGPLPRPPPAPLPRPIPRPYRCPRSGRSGRAQARPSPAHAWQIARALRRRHVQWHPAARGGRQRAAGSGQRTAGSGQRAAGSRQHWLLTTCVIFQKSEPTKGPSEGPMTCQSSWRPSAAKRRRSSESAQRHTSNAGYYSYQPLLTSKSYG